MGKGLGPARHVDASSSCGNHVPIGTVDALGEIAPGRDPVSKLLPIVGIEEHRERVVLMADIDAVFGRLELVVAPKLEHVADIEDRNVGRGPDFCPPAIARLDLDAALASAPNDRAGAEIKMRPTSDLPRHGRQLRVINTPKGIQQSGPLVDNVSSRQIETFLNSAKYFF